MLAQRADQPLQCRPVEPARPQQARCLPAEVEDGALHAHRAGPAVQDEVDRVAEVGRDMRRRGRADQARGVGAGGRQRQQDRLEQRPRHGVGGDADRDRVQPGGGDPGQGRALGPGQDQRQRPRPERRRHGLGPLVEAGEGPRAGEVGDVDDQGVVRRPALGAIEPGHRGVVGGDRTQAVDGLGRECDQPAPAQQPRRLGDRRGVGRTDPAQRSGPQPLQPGLGDDGDQGQLHGVAQEERQHAQGHGLLGADEAGEPGRTQEVDGRRPGQQAGHGGEPVPPALRDPAHDAGRGDEAQE